MTYDNIDEFLHIGAVYAEQVLLRPAYVVQCKTLKLPVPVFEGLLRDLPAYNNR